MPLPNMLHQTYSTQQKKVIVLSFFTGVQQQDGVNSRTLLRKLDRVIGIKYLHDLNI